MDESVPNPDAQYFSFGEGISQVPLERWREAQAAECDLWMREGVWWIEDRNALHAERFDQYRALQGASFPDALEVGCGPFGNLRLIAHSCHIDRVSLLDPLLSEYVHHPACRYSPQGLIIDTQWPPKLLRNLAVKLGKRWPVLGRACMQMGRRALSREILPIKTLLAKPAEELDCSDTFDLIVMINVLEHCYDAKKVCQRVLAALKPGGTLVFHDHYYSGNEPLPFYDAFHPLRVTREFVTSELLQFFTRVLHKEETFEESLGEDWPAVYFIGRKS